MSRSITWAGVCIRSLLAGSVAVLALALASPAPAAADPVPLAQVGSTGSGAGQLNVPAGVALDGAGNLYVADQANHRISVFGADGSFIHAFGWGVDTGAAAFEACTTASGCQTGSSGGGAGQLNFPQGVALDGAGNLYVADVFNHRISVFGTAGPSFTRAFGWGVDTGAAAFQACTAASGCQAGGGGGGAGQLNFPQGVALDGAGDVYVADSSNNRISVFDAAGPSFLRAFGWAVDTGAAAFEVCTAASTCQGGSQGEGAGQLIDPPAVALDGAGNVYVADRHNHRISVFAAAGPSFTHAFGWRVDTGAAAFEVCTAASTCQGGSNGGGAGQLEVVQGVALDGAGNVYVADDNSRISVFDAAGPSFTRAFGWAVDTGAAAFEVCTAASGCATALRGAGAGQLHFPIGVALDCRGAAWVADTENDRLQRFGEPGTALPPCGAPAADGGGAPSNAFTIGKLRGRTLSLDLGSAGEVEIIDARARTSGSAASAAAIRKRLKRSSASGGPGQIAVKLRLTKAAKTRLREKGKVKVRARITFTPSGGTPNTETRKLKVKGKRKK